MKRVLLLAALLLACVAPNLRAEEKCAICGKPAIVCIGVAGPHVPWCVEHIGVMPAAGGFVIGPPILARPGESTLPRLQWSFPAPPANAGAPLAPGPGFEPPPVGARETGPGGYVNPDEEYVRGYYRNGRWVSGHWRTKANKTPTDNLSHAGNVNPHTGKRGYKH